MSGPAPSSSNADAEASTQVPPPPPPPQAIHHELRTASNSASYLLPTLSSLVASKPALELLDVGAGSGTISVTLAQRIPGGKVTAVDLDAGILPRARAVAAAAGVENITFSQADAYALPFDDGAFDVTHCHQVLTHLREPWKIISEMLRVTRTGGSVACREGDLDSEVVWPALEGMKSFHDLTAKLIQYRGGSSCSGRQLLDWALKAGAKRDAVTVTFGTWGYSSEDEKKIWGE